jgi:glucose-6-phosphate isomerase
VVVVPPAWAHATVSASAAEPMTFGAWCDREYGFAYDEVRALGGLAYFPLLGADGAIRWERNPRYPKAPPLVERRARAYPELGLVPGEPIYRTFARDPEAVQWVSDPARVASLWQGFEP